LKFIFIYWLKVFLRTMPKIYIYRVVNDTGYAPNFADDVATLAACKPQIRKTAAIGDWIVGLASKNLYKDGTTHKNLPRNTIVWCMQVTDKLTFADYDALCTSTLINKIPRRENGFRGDCQIKADGTFREGEHSSALVAHDLTGKFVLLGEKYYYSANNFEILPEWWNADDVNRGHRVLREPTDDQISFLERIVD
jgi:hypothetical protein